MVYDITFIDVQMIPSGYRFDFPNTIYTVWIAEDGIILDFILIVIYNIYRISRISACNSERTMKLSVKSEYACLALIHLTKHHGKEKLCPIREIAEAQHIPRKYLEQILISLKRGGYVKSYKGAEGGYRLAKDPASISVAEIIRFMDGALAPVESASKYFYEKTPIERSEKLLQVLKQIRNHVSEILESVTFDKLS